MFDVKTFPIKKEAAEKLKKIVANLAKIYPRTR